MLRRLRRALAGILRLGKTVILDQDDEGTLPITGSIGGVTLARIVSVIQVVHSKEKVSCAAHYPAQATADEKGLTAFSKFADQGMQSSIR